MTSISTSYEKLKKFLDEFISGNGYTNIMTGYITGELQFLIFIIVLAALFRMFSFPLAIIMLILVTALALYFTPTIIGVEKENSNDLNRVLYWFLIYFAIIIAITLWGG
ncbi:MAG: hypothetical protein NZ922_02575 [Candidatus Methanomethyliaceae archaeon]|nr:hypothetical protein [Candidatus Methanomethyliaceae archaeon]MDW7970914.1 hypothetical protein [Nitrososphaerota archaeon]